MRFPFRAAEIDEDPRHMDVTSETKTIESKIKGNKLKCCSWICCDGYTHELY